MQWTVRQQLFAGLSSSGVWTFTAGQIADILSMPRRRVAFFIDEGIVEPASTALGQGHARKFGLVELQLIELFRQLDQLGIAPRYLKQIGPEVRRLVEDYSGWPLPEGMPREYPTPKQRKAEGRQEQFPNGLIVIYKDERRDRLCARSQDYQKLAGKDYSGSLDLVAFTVIDLRALVEQTYHKAYDQLPG